MAAIRPIDTSFDKFAIVPREKPKPYTPLGNTFSYTPEPYTPEQLMTLWHQSANELYQNIITADQQRAQTVENERKQEHDSMVQASHNANTANRSSKKWGMLCIAAPTLTTVATTAALTPLGIASLICCALVLLEKIDDCFNDRRITEATFRKFGELLNLNTEQQQWLDNASSMLLSLSAAGLSFANVRLARNVPALFKKFFALLQTTFTGITAWYNVKKHWSDNETMQHQIAAEERQEEFEDLTKDSERLIEYLQDGFKQALECQKSADRTHRSAIKV